MLSLRTPPSSLLFFLLLVVREYLAKEESGVRDEGFPSLGTLFFVVVKSVSLFGDSIGLIGPVNKD